MLPIGGLCSSVLSNMCFRWFFRRWENVLFRENFDFANVTEKDVCDAIYEDDWLQWSNCLCGKCLSERVNSVFDNSDISLSQSNEITQSVAITLLSCPRCFDNVMGLQDLVRVV